MHTILLLTAALLAVPSPAPAQDPPEGRELGVLTEQLREQETLLELEKRSVPPASAFEVAEAEAACQRMAQEAGLTSPQIRAAASSQAIPYPDGRPSPVQQRFVEISGRDPYEKVDRFLGLLTGSPRPVEVQALRISAAAANTVTFQARIGFAFVGDPAAAAPSSDELLDRYVARRKQIEDASRAAAERQDLQTQRLLAERRMLLDRMVELRRAFVEARDLTRLLTELRQRGESSRVVPGALAAFTTWAAEDPVALTAVRFDGKTVIEGVTLGTSAHESLKTTLGASGFEVADIKTTPRGRCHAFTATLQFPMALGTDKRVGGNGLFDDQTGAACSMPLRKATARIEARGAGGPVTVRMRDVDVADLVQLVFQATDYGFVVDPDVTLVVDADLSGSTPEQVIEALKGAGLSVGPGPLRRVSLASKRAPAPERTTYSGKTLSVAFKSADVADILCLLKDVAETAILSPPGFDGRMSLYAKDVPWDQILDAGAASLDLTFVRASGQRRAFLGPAAAARMPDHPGAVEPCSGYAGHPVRRWNAQPPTTGILNMRDLRLAGFAQIDGKWSGYAYGPFSNVLLPLTPEYVLLDGDIVAVGPTSVTVETKDKKRVELTLP